MFFYSKKNGGMNCMASTVKIYEEERMGKIVQFPVDCPEVYNTFTDNKSRTESTRMECLYTTDEIVAVYNVFENKLYEATTLSKKRDAIRNLTMYVCAINIGLRAGDLCALKWKAIFDGEWNIKDKADFIPQKTTRHDRTGKIIKRKHITLRYDSDFKKYISSYLAWVKNNIGDPNLEDYVFLSQKGSHIQPKQWHKIVQRHCNQAGIKQKIGTHGLRKTYGHRYYITSNDKQSALIQLMEIFGHSDMRITLTYICITDEEIAANQERMCIFTDENIDETVSSSLINYERSS